MVQLLMEYGQRHQLLLGINEKDDDGNNPLHLSIINNNTEMVKLLMEYAKEHDLNLGIQEKKR